MRFLLDNVDSDDMEQTRSQTESSRERGFSRDFTVENLGCSDEPGNESTGDIADEGSGHRG